MLFDFPMPGVPNKWILRAKILTDYDLKNGLLMRRKSMYGSGYTSIGRLQST